MTEIGVKGAKFSMTDVKIGSVASRASSTIFVIVCVVPMLTTLLYGGVDAVVLGLQAVFAAAIVILWIRDAWVTEGLRFSSSPLQLPVAGLLLIALVQLLPLSDHGVTAGLLNVSSTHSLSLDPFATRMFAVRIFIYFIFFAAALAFVDTTTRAKRLATLIVIFGAVIGFFGVLQRLANPEAIYGLRPTPQAIPFGPFINQHHFAAFMVITFGLSLGMILSSGIKRDRKTFLGLAAVMSAIGLFFTGSRGGVLSIAGTIFFAVVAAYTLQGNEKSAANPTKKDFRVMAVVAAIAGALIVIGSVFYLGGGDSLLRGIGASQNYIDVSSGRIHFWQTSLEIIKQNPVIGVGFDAFGVAFSRFDTQSGMFRIENAHNEYLQVFAEGGIVGFACLAAFLYLLFRRGINNIASIPNGAMRGIAIGGLAACFGLAIHSFFDFPLRTPSNALFFFLLIVLATTPFSIRESPTASVS